MTPFLASKATKIDLLSFIFVLFGVYAFYFQYLFCVHLVVHFISTDVDLWKHSSCKENDLKGHDYISFT